MSVEEDKKLRDQINSLQRELRGTQEMLYQVLKEIGEPVVVSRDTMDKGVQDNVQITIVQDTETDDFIFSLTEVVEDVDAEE